MSAERIVTADHVLSQARPALEAMGRELVRQHERWGEQNHPDGTGPDVVWSFTGPASYVAASAKAATDEAAKAGALTWRDVLLEELAEAFEEEDEDRLAVELEQVAAVAVQWRTAIARRQRRRAVEDLIARHVDSHYGVRVLELGEDGGTLVVLGHHEDRRTLAALNRYARKTWGHGLDEALGNGYLDLDLKRVRAIVVHACHRGWSAEDPIATADLELVDGTGPACPDCDEVGATWALLYRDDAQDHPAAFPVTVWEYDA